MKKYSSYTFQAKLTRIDAMRWWNSLSIDAKRYWTEFYYPKRDFRSLTGIEYRQLLAGEINLLTIFIN